MPFRVQGYFLSLFSPLIVGVGDGVRKQSGVTVFARPMGAMEENMRSSAFRTGVIALGLGAMMAAGDLKAGLDLPAGQPIFSREGYDYAPSTLVEGSVMRMWWCGIGPVPGTVHLSDVIYYRTYNLDTGTYSPISVVLQPTRDGVTWDSFYICDPSVIKGSFFNSDDGQTYKYAMYYTATDRSDGRNNRIGIAYSSNGTSWVRRPNPVIYPQVYPTATTYGAGQASTYNGNGQASIRIFYTDSSTSAGPRTFARHATDGVNFGPPTLISNTNNAGVTMGAGGGYAYDHESKHFYAITGTRPFRPTDREGYQLGLFRMPAASFLAGEGTWENLAFFNTANTGFHLNHNPEFLKDAFGNLTGFLPDVTVFFGAGDADPSTWELVTASWNPSPSTMPLKRYYTHTGCPETPISQHWVTTGSPPDCNYQLKHVLGYMKMTSVAGGKPLHGCMAGDDHFLSESSGCEGWKRLGIEGWIYNSPGTGRVPIYRCLVTGQNNHFVSLYPNCEGQTVEGLYGYILSNP